VKLVEQWNAVERSLDPSWWSVTLALTLSENGRGDRAAALLGPANPGRSGNTIRFTVARGGVGVGPEAARRLLRRLDEEGIDGTLEVVGSEAAAAREPEPRRASLAEQWDAALAALPSDWSDLYCEVDLQSTDHLDPAALRLAPVNPLRFGEAPGFRFRCAHHHGYGASPEMVRRCLVRLDEAGMPGEVRVLYALSDTHPVQTQGPVWHVGGRTV
jgi:hypothetical protein